MKFRIQSLLVNSFVFLLGFLSLLAPFVVPQARDASFSSTSFPVMVSLIIVLCVLIILLEAQSTILNTKLIAFLGILIALNAGLRFLKRPSLGRPALARSSF